MVIPESGNYINPLPLPLVKGGRDRVVDTTFYFLPSMSEILQGRQLAQAIREKVAKQIKKEKQPLGLAAILVGNNSASKLYVSLKEQAAKEVGMYFERFDLPARVSQKELIDVIEKLNARNDINGILVQFPLPNQNEDKVVRAIDPRKDIDGFHPINREGWSTEHPAIFPPVALATMELINASHQPLHGKQAVIIGNSELFAQPITVLLNKEGVDVQRFSPDESALASKTRTADIVIVAVGRADFLTRDMVKDGAIVIDIGTNKKEGKNVGDAAENVKGVAGFISPVPGGVGPLTVAYLLKNVVDASKMQKK
ncbi:MAG: Bifunctional protein FolD [Candidatus Uhrbacteria bacterium GW2011_GWD2_41_121]|uniref:Bifunctional protein FolD n=1 Tax=Candidatus Uhrbacteria bacterium GW2011_GWC1_41_20 TaxID=1618983 RepID=A0A0G0VEH4_9BACT|nr:MAG: Bifunctional protein FolD [Candidatus Uhrbacteria bacterium GW2011_GWE1_39_46]KKR63977.1 MAG: Bifunctional protein FolD [Candidatus Uhrbacteria bacterium GW2011_GWC2_40_450]KKR90236.1 MAG: Bifunctional protein FolD [Candidatus Uhrbacteria bacterium GW2011_GWD2_41_121]KKR95617.1 MAG: Bifunctional protein FolD [Candidatus Uhrbacteria bacterium GW2011_GWD1_41_16]KKR99264.1 MAG: bifunctional 5,10-methylene-tetrahydrofolate dehydrogenase/5,10-methylene-tetrahydrofolate cyclohydrolase, methyl